VFAILASVQAGMATLLSSEALEFEISQIPDEQRRREALAILTLASERLLLSDISEQLAESIASAGLSAMDALHVALAATARADYFVTADDKLLRKAKSLSNLAVKPVSVLELISEIPP
jgi:predicted nucleic acid-binding protein